MQTDMRFKSGFTIAAAICIASICGCRNNSANESADKYMGINTLMPVPVQAKALIDSLTPAQTAKSLVKWLSGASAADRDYARKLTRSIVGYYTSEYDAHIADTFIRSIDSICYSLPKEKQVRVYTVVTAPDVLARMVRADSDSAAIVPLIIDAYGTDSTAVSLFIAELNK